MAQTHGTQSSQGNTGRTGDIKDRAENTGANLGASAGRKVGEGVEKAQQAASNLTERAKDTAAGTMERVKDTASDAVDKVKDAASNLGSKAQEYASTAGQKMEDATSYVGERMSSWGSSLRQGTPHEGMMGSAAGAVADTLESSGQYLQQHDFGDMADDLGGVIRRYPIQSLLVAFGVGCLIGMTSRR